MNKLKGLILVLSIFLATIANAQVSGPWDPYANPTPNPSLFPRLPRLPLPPIRITVPPIRVPSIGGTVGGNLLCTNPITQVSIDYNTAVACANFPGGQVCSLGAGVTASCTLNNYTRQVDCNISAGIPGVAGVAVGIGQSSPAYLQINCSTGVISVLNMIKNNPAANAPVFNF